MTGDEVLIIFFVLCGIILTAAVLYIAISPTPPGGYDVSGLYNVSRESDDIRKLRQMKEYDFYNNIGRRRD